MKMSQNGLKKAVFVQNFRKQIRASGENHKMGVLIIFEGRLNFGRNGIPPYNYRLESIDHVSVRKILIS